MKKFTAFFAAVAMAVSMAGGALMVQASEGKTDLTIAIDADVDVLHPSDFSTTVEHDILSQIYDPLMYMNPDGTHDPEPRIAESYEVSEDGMDYTFHLRDDVTFHDGSALTAADVQFSLEMYMDSEYQGSQVTGLASVETPDDYTVVCHLENPYSPFMLGVCQVHIASKAYFESSEEDFVNAPIGSGPYKFVGRNKGSNVTLEAYENYYRGAATIQNVTFEVIPDQSTTAMALQTGEVDFASIESSTIAQLGANDTITIAEVPTSGFTYVSMNTEKEPFNDAKVRQAINYAINRENIVAVCYDGEAEVNSNICSKDRFGYSEEQPQYTYDPEKAKALLEEAGIATPYDLGELLVAEKYSNLATVLQSDLAAVGLNVTIGVKEFNAYIDELTSGSYGITALEMTLDGDSQMLEMAFTTDYIGTANNARYSDAEMDELFNKTRTETDTDARAELFNQILTKAQDEAIYAVIANPLTLYAYNSSLQCPEFPFEGIYSIYDFAW
ncbi:MAG: ABC transporter substrate-binding protein [Lachnospiraceae bacterium]|nr:ABC transporter substrate-binding protein [Lachnospiraceae bacterium]